MRRIYSAVLVAYNDSAWLAAFTARKVLGFCLTAIKDWHGRHSYLLQATKVNLLAHRKASLLQRRFFGGHRKVGAKSRQRY